MKTGQMYASLLKCASSPPTAHTITLSTLTITEGDDGDLRKKATEQRMTIERLEKEVAEKNQRLLMASKEHSRSQ